MTPHLKGYNKTNSLITLKEIYNSLVENGGPKRVSLFEQINGRRHYHSPNKKKLWTQFLDYQIFKMICYKIDFAHLRKMSMLFETLIF